MSRSVQVVSLRRTGGAESLLLEERLLPSPCAGEVVVEHKAIGVNYIDIYHRTGLYPVELPSVLGLEAAGIVSACGEGVEEFSEGDRVGYNSAGLGGYSSARLVKADRLVHLPESLDFETAAACLLRGMTVEFLVERCFPVQAGHKVLLHAAAGGLGGLACQWLKRRGAYVIGTVGSEEKAAHARSCGCDETILYREQPIAERVRALTEGRGVDVVYDSVGAKTFLASLESLKPRGMLVSFGNASGAVSAFDLGLLARKGSLYVTRPSLFSYVGTRSELLASSRRLFEELEGGLRVSIAARLALSDAREAHEMLESRAALGALVLLPEGI